MTYHFALKKYSHPVQPLQDAAPDGRHPEFIFYWPRLRKFFTFNFIDECALPSRAF